MEHDGNFATEQTLPYKDKAPDGRKTLVYCRESRDENGENYQAIVTQREILLEFCSRKGLRNIVGVVMDDDVSGTGFKRLQGILERIRNGEVEVIVFKDASRLGRNLRDSLNFIHELEVAGAEILFESEDYDEDVFPLLAWFNERRAKDDSLKIRRVLRHKMEQGGLVTQWLYGYTHPVGNRMEIDPETGAVVREIFTLFLAGRGTSEIAGILNRRGTPTPSQAHAAKRAAYAWNRQHVWRILCNDAYTGRMTHGKRTTVSFKNKRTVHNPPEAWVVVENHHPALVSPEQFARAQAMRAHAAKTRSGKGGRPFSGLLQCGRCGCSLVLRQRAGRRDAYLCGKNQREGAVKDHIREHYGCAPHRVREESLYEIACRYIQQLLREEKEAVDAAVRAFRREDPRQKRIAELEGRMGQWNRVIENIYEDKLRGVISEQLFCKKYGEYRERLTAAEKELEALGPEHGAPRSVSREPEFGEILQSATGQIVRGLQLKELFDRIICYNPGDVTLEDKERYGMTDALYGELLRDGGLLFLENTARAENAARP